MIEAASLATTNHTMFGAINCGHVLFTFSRCFCQFPQTFAAAVRIVAVLVPLCTVGKSLMVVLLPLLNC
jgi:hypothetical protein